MSIMIHFNFPLSFILFLQIRVVVFLLKKSRALFGDSDVINCIPKVDYESIPKG